MSDIADHIEQVREAAGVDHIGIGGDFDGCDPMPEMLTDVAGYPALIDELLARNWSESDLAALTNRNAIRVLRGAERGTSAATC